MQCKIHKQCPNSPEFHCVLLDTGWCNDFIKNARKINSSSRTQAIFLQSGGLSAKSQYIVFRWQEWIVGMLALSCDASSAAVWKRRRVCNLEIAKDGILFLRIHSNMLILQRICNSHNANHFKYWYIGAEPNFLDYGKWHSIL